MSGKLVAAALIITVSAVVTTSFGAGNSGELRLTRVDIDAMAKQGAGAGTSGVAGIQTTTLLGNPTQPGPYVIEIRVPANTRIQAHKHRDARSAVVISGAWYFGYGATASESLVKKLDPGSFYTEPADVPHFALTKDQPAVVYISGMGPTDTVYSTPTHAP